MLHPSDIANFFIWGTGALSRELYRDFLAARVPILGFVSGTLPHPQSFFDIKVYSPLEFVNILRPRAKRTEVTYLIIASSFEEEIQEKICELQIDKHVVVLKKNEWSNLDFKKWNKLFGENYRSRIYNWQTDYNIKFSFIIHNLNSTNFQLERCLNSIKKQTYNNYEVILTFFHTPTAITSESLNELDIQTLGSNSTLAGHKESITNLTNGCNIATGEFLVFLSADFFIDSDCLEVCSKFLARSLNSNTHTQLIYTDEVFLGNAHHESQHICKPVFDPLFLLQSNYIGNSLIVRGSFLRKMGYFLNEAGSSCFYDFCLRAVKELPKSEVTHIPAMLFLTTSHLTAEDFALRQNIIKMEKACASHHIRRLNLDTRVVEDSSESIHPHVSFLPKKFKRVSIIVPTRDEFEIVSNCVKSFFEHTNYPRVQFIIVDNGTSDREALEFFNFARDQYGVHVISSPGDFNFSRLVNLGAAASDGEYLLLLNNDISVLPECKFWLSDMVGLAQSFDIKVVGAKLLYPNDRLVQHGGVILGFNRRTRVAGHKHKFFPGDSTGYLGSLQASHYVSAVTAACMLVARDTFDRVGGFDEGLRVAYNDIDFCLKVAQQGESVGMCGTAMLLHHESKSRGRDRDEPTKWARFVKERDLMLDRWRGRLFDEFYNPNLSLESHTFPLAFPPRLNEQIAHGKS